MRQAGWNTRRLWLALGLAVLTSVQTGCVALGIPSVRYDDPSDRGGLLGPQRPADPSAPAELGAAGCSAAGCQSDGQQVEPEPPPVPAVPWPRFHPLPTRPVFSPSLSDSY